MTFIMVIISEVKLSYSPGTAVCSIHCSILLVCFSLELSVVTSSQCTSTGLSHPSHTTAQRESATPHFPCLHLVPLLSLSAGPNSHLRYLLSPGKPLLSSSPCALLASGFQISEKMCHHPPAIPEGLLLL